jgi:hypothetical protein
LRQLAHAPTGLAGNYPQLGRIFLAKVLSECDIAGGDAIARLGFGVIMSRLKLIVPAALVLGGFLVCSTASYGKPEYTKSTKKACVYCHVDAQKAPKDLKSPGKYYQEHKSLDGYVDKK